MDKPNQFKSSEFHMDAGDIIHMIFKGESGIPISVELMGVGSTVPEDYGGDTLEDYDGNEYTEVTIGNQKWIVENFRCIHYADGTVIPEIQNAVAWDADTTGAYCWYDNDAVTYADYGPLYNWHAVDNAHVLPYLTRGGVQETGWRVPTKEDLEELETYLGGKGMWYLIGEKIKEIGTTHWATPNNADNNYGLTALGGGQRSGGGTFQYMTTYGQYWSSTAYTTFFKYFLRLINSYGLYSITYGNRDVGLSVRLVKPMAVTETAITITTTKVGEFVVTLNGSGSISINWGDGNITNAILTEETEYGHVYIAGGTITITGISGITSISANDMDVTSCSIPNTVIALTAISLMNNSLTSFTTYAEWMTLEELDLTSNNLTSLTTYAEWTALTDLLIGGNSVLSSIVLHAEWVNIERINCSACALTSVTTYDTWISLNYVDFSNNTISTFTAHDTWVALADLILGSCGLTAFTTENTWTALKVLNLANNSLSALTTYNTWTALEQLLVNGNSLTALIMHPEWIALYALNIGNNSLTTVTMHPEWVNLVYLYCGECDLSTLEVHSEWASFYLMHANGNAITSATDINNILIEFDAIGMTLGEVILNDGTNAAPTGAGITAKNSLETAGVSVTTN